MHISMKKVSIYMILVVLSERIRGYGYVYVLKVEKLLCSHFIDKNSFVCILNVIPPPSSSSLLLTNISFSSYLTSPTKPQLQTTDFVKSPQWE
jgi:hypothetical protein